MQYSSQNRRPSPPESKRAFAIIIIVATIIAVLAFKPWDTTPVDPPRSVEKVQTSTSAESPKPLPAPFSKSAYSTDDPDSMWVVANKQRPLNPKNYAPNDLVSVGGGQQLREVAASAFIELQAAAQAAGLSIKPLSGYRSYDTQVRVYGNEVASYGQSTADTQSARPGHSEHQTGLALDVGGGGCGIEECFGDTDEGKWTAANAHRYGFIVRYQRSNTATTGYTYEPWHIRYVGTELATELQNTGVTTLEEFFGLPAAPTY